MLSARNLAQYNKYRLQTGLCKPTLFSGLIMLGVPGIFTMDLMYLSVLNDPDLLLGLWRGTVTPFYFLRLILSGAYYHLVLIFHVYLVLPAFAAYQTSILTRDY